MTNPSSCPRPHHQGGSAAAASSPVPAHDDAPPAGRAVAVPDNLEECRISLAIALPAEGPAVIDLTHFDGLLNGATPASFVLSSSSSHSFISQDAAARAGLPFASTIPKRCRENMMGSLSLTLGTVVSPVVIQGYAGNLALEVLPSISYFDVVLGRDWTLTLDNASIQYGDPAATVQFKHRGRKVVLTSTPKRVERP